jgi:phosphoribosylformylglycinamidine synthase
MKFAVIVFPGSNCDRDCYHVVGNVVGAEVDFVWHRERDLSGFDAVIVPGGFSYGDYLRAGAVAKMSPVMESVRDYADKGGPVIGICNGFQILLENGLLPGAMQRNNTLRFMCKDVFLRCESTRTPFTTTLEKGQVIELPIANAEGNYFIDSAGLEKLRDNDQIVFTYSDAHGAVHAGSNPNGSVGNIAGICNQAGNVLGMMPHPERAAEAVLGNTDGLALFLSILERQAA